MFLLRSHWQSFGRIITTGAFLLLPIAQPTFAQIGAASEPAGTTQSTPSDAAPAAQNRTPKKLSHPKEAGHPHRHALWVQGDVADVSGAKIRGAQVSVFGSGAQALAQGTTDAHGAFRFEVAEPGNYRVTVAARGFRTTEKKNVVVRRGAPSSLAISLAVDVKADTITVVSATGQLQELRDAPASISVITQEDLEKQPVYDLSQVLREMPGVTGGLASSGEISKISIRGMDQKYTLFLVDGRRVGYSGQTNYREDLGRQDLNWIPPEMIERIEVIRGPMSTLYGSDAMGGLVNIITKPIQQKWHGSASVTYTKPEDDQRGDDKQAALQASGPLSKQIGFRGFFSYTQQSEDKVALSSKNYSNGNGGERDQDGGGTLTWAPSKQQKFTLDGSFGQQDALAWNGGAAYGASKLNRLSLDLGYDGHYRFGDLSSSVYDTRYENVVAGQNQKSEDFIVDSAFDKSFPKGWLGAHLLRTGLQYHYMSLTNSRTLGTSPILANATPSNSGHQGALFGEDTVALRENLLLTLGGRWDQNYLYGASFSPRVYAVYHLKHDWTMRGGIARGFRAPDLKQNSAGSATASRGSACRLNSGWTSGTCYVIGNPNLKPETTWTTEAGVAYDHKNYHVSGTYFITNFHNKIENEPYGYADGYWWILLGNVNHARSSGLEVSSEARLGRTITLRSNWTWLIESKNLDTNEQLINTPQLSSTSSIDFHPMQKYSTQLEAVYTGNQLGSDTCTNISACSYSAIIRPYTIYNWSMSYKPVKYAKIRGGIENLTDESVGASTGYTYYVPGRRYSIGLMTSF